MFPDDPIKAPATDVCSDWLVFVNRLAGWIQSRRRRKDTNRLGLVFEAVRREESIWGGCGVYTTSEILCIAGMHLSTIVSVLFDSLLVF